MRAPHDGRGVESLAVAKPQVTTALDSARPSFTERFIAWWEGYELATGRPAPMGAAAIHDVRYARASEHWETTRLQLAQQVWGEGFIGPGGEEQILSMIKLFGLDPAMSVLDLGAGLGAATRCMSDNFGVWVSGLDSDPQLVEAGMALSTKAGMAKKAPIQLFDPGNFDLKPNSVDCVFSKEFLFTVADKRVFLKAVENLLKSRGQLLFTDYMFGEGHKAGPTFDKWLKHEPRAPHPWSVNDYREALGELHLDIRVVEDNTDAFHKNVIAAWADYIRAIRSSGVNDETAAALVDEVELWTRRMQLIENGDLRICRIHALKKDTKRLMSNW